MSKDFCMDCGMVLSPHTNICAVCGFDNTYDEYLDLPPDLDQVIDLTDDSMPEHHPGF